MDSNQAVASGHDDNVVPLSRPGAAKNGWIYENLRNLFEHFTQQKAETDSQLAAIAREKAEADARLTALDSRTRKLATSTELLIRETNTLTSSGEHVSQELKAISDALDSSLDQLGKRSSGAEEKLASLNEQVQQIEAATRELDSRTENLVRRTLDLEESDKRLAEETEGLKARMAQIEPRQQALEESARRLFRDTEVLARKTGRLTDNFQKGAWITGGAVLVLAMALGATGWLNASRIEGVSVSTSEQISEARSDLKAGIERLTAEGPGSAAVDRRIGALQSQIDTKTATAIALEIETAELSEEVQDLNQRLETFQGEIGIIKDRIYAPDEPLRGTAVDMSGVRDTSWLKAQNPDHYVIQLVSVYRKQELAEYIARYQRYLPMDQLSYSKTLHKGRDMYVLLLGNFGKFSEAMDELDALPTALQKNRPYLRTMRGVQRRMT